MAIEQKRLNLYLIDIKYIRNPAKADDHVMLREYVMSLAQGIDTLLGQV